MMQNLDFFVDALHGIEKPMVTQTLLRDLTTVTSELGSAKSDSSLFSHVIFWFLNYDQRIRSTNRSGGEKSPGIRILKAQQRLTPLLMPKSIHSRSVRKHIQTGRSMARLPVSLNSAFGDCVNG